MANTKKIKARQYLNTLDWSSQDPEKVLFINSNNIKQKLIDLIETSEKCIYVTALYWEKDEAGKQIIEAIYQRMVEKPELKVKILVDFFRAQRGRMGEGGECKTNADWYLELEKKYYPFIGDRSKIFYAVPISTKEVFGVLHLKGFIFDNNIIYSGASINNVYLHNLGRYRCDRWHQITNDKMADALIKLTEEQILSDEAVMPFVENMPTAIELKSKIRKFRHKLANCKFFPNIEDDNSYSLKLTALLGLGRGYNLLNTAILNLFDATERKITICTPYFNPPKSVEKKIKSLLLRAKSVEIIIGDKTANDFYREELEPFHISAALPYLYEQNLRSFAKKYHKYIENGQLTIRIWKDENNSFHLKGIWIDDEYMLLTGNNLNPRAWRLDIENAILFWDKDKKLWVKNQAELVNIRSNTIVLTSYENLSLQNSYPEKIYKVLKRVKSIRADKIVKMLL